MLNVNMFVRENNRRVAVVVTGGLKVKDLEVLLDLVLIDLEVEVRLGLDLAVNVGCKALLLFAFKLLLEAKGIQLLLDKRGNAVLDLLDVIVIAILNLADLGENTLLLLGATERSEPFGLSGFLFLLFAKVCL